MDNVATNNEATNLQESIKVASATGQSVKIVFVSSDYPRIFDLIRFASLCISYLACEYRGHSPRVT